VAGVPPELAPALRGLRRASLPLVELGQAATVRGALDVLALTLDGRAAAVTTVRRKRSVFYNVLQYTVDLELLDFNPVDNRPQSGKRWTDSGEAHDRRGLKHRADAESRGVPIPPELVTILREHIDRYGVADDARLFRSERGNVVAASTYSRVWEEARALALAPHQVASPLAGRPYDLRHAAVSLWLNPGAPATEVADRAGHSVDVLSKVYAKCIDGQEATVNQRIGDASQGFGG